MIYNLTEKFLLLFPLYREWVRVMDSYALRLSEAVEALRREKGEREGYENLANSCRKSLENHKAALEEQRSLANRALAYLGPIAQTQGEYATDYTDDGLGSARAHYPTFQEIHGEFMIGFTRAKRRKEMMMVKNPSPRKDTP